MTNPHINRLNRRLGDALGRLCGGSIPRFSWRWAPAEPWFVFDSDDRTLIKKTWADAPATDGGKIGRAWVLGEWRRNTSFDHHGYGQECEDCKGAGYSFWSGGIGRRPCAKCGGRGRIIGIRIPVAREWAYAPYFETAIGRGREPDEAMNQNYIWALDRMIQQSAAENDGGMDELLAEEKYTMERQNRRGAKEHLEASRRVYDDNVGAFGNCEVGVGDGFMGFGGIGDSPILKRFQEAAG
jgi:hypothetical protein